MAINQRIVDVQGDWRNMSITEIAAENKKVSAYVEHWEGRALKAEGSLHNDYPEMDGTEFAHPAWWRGHDHGLAVVCRKVNAILDGIESNGIASEPWHSLQQRLYAIRSLLNYAQNVMDQVPMMSPYRVYKHYWNQLRKAYAKKRADNEPART